MNSEYEIFGWCFEEPIPQVDFFLWASTIEKWVWKTVGDIKPGEVFTYNQLEVNPYSCTLVATYGALSDLSKNKNGIVTRIMPYSEMKKTLEKMTKDGKFRPGSGAYLKDGVQYATDSFNKFFGTNHKPVQIIMNANNVIIGMKHSSVVTGVKASSAFFKDMQDNGVVDVANQVGNIGHAMRLGKFNTLDDILGKFIQNYKGAITKYGTVAKDVILFDFEDNVNVLFNTGFYFI